MDQYLISPYRHAHNPTDQDVVCWDTILQLIHKGKESLIFKDLPQAMLIALALGPLIQILRADMTGILPLNYELINKTIEASWEAVSLQKVPYLRRWQEDAKGADENPKGYPTSQFYSNVTEGKRGTGAKLPTCAHDPNTERANV